MKKVCLIITGIILTTLTFGQVPWKVKEDLRIIDGDTIAMDTLEVNEILVGHKKNKFCIEFIWTEKPCTKGSKNLFHQKELVKITKAKFGEDVIYDPSTYRAYNESLGEITYIESLGTMTGKICLDESNDGKIDRIFILN